jgi:hypothetical protein
MRKKRVEVRIRLIFHKVRIEGVIQLILVRSVCVAGRVREVRGKEQQREQLSFNKLSTNWRAKQQVGLTTGRSSKS